MQFEPERILVRVEGGVDHAEGDGRVGRSAREDGGDGGRSAGAAVGAALGGGGGVGGSEWGKGGEAMRWVARVDLRVEWANEAVCATWEEIREEVERAEAEALLLAGRGIGSLGTLRWDSGYPAIELRTF